MKYLEDFGVLRGADPAAAGGSGAGEEEYLLGDDEEVWEEGSAGLSREGEGSAGETSRAE
jgi:hypothetical protein